MIVGKDELRQFAFTILLVFLKNGNKALGVAWVFNSIHEMLSFIHLDPVELAFVSVDENFLFIIGKLDPVNSAIASKLTNTSLTLEANKWDQIPHSIDEQPT